MISVMRFFVFNSRRSDLVNSSSRANSLAIWAVKRASGEAENRWRRICSEIFSLFILDILGIFVGDIRFI